MVGRLAATRLKRGLRPNRRDMRVLLAPVLLTPSGVTHAIHSSFHLDTCSCPLIAQTISCTWDNGGDAHSTAMAAGARLVCFMHTYVRLFRHAHSASAVLHVGW